MNGLDEWTKFFSFGQMAIAYFTFESSFPLKRSRYSLPTCLELYKGVYTHPKQIGLLQENAPAGNGICLHRSEKNMVCCQEELSEL
jgi:hypothetical protein